MLRGIDAPLAPKLLQALASTGDGDEPGLADANGPALNIERRIAQPAGAHGRTALAALEGVGNRVDGR